MSASRQQFCRRVFSRALGTESQPHEPACVESQLCTCYDCSQGERTKHYGPVATGAHAFRSNHHIVVVSRTPRDREFKGVDQPPTEESNLLRKRIKDRSHTHTNVSRMFNANEGNGTRGNQLRSLKDYRQRVCGNLCSLR